MRALIFSCLLGVSSIALAEPIHNAPYNFSFVVPDGFVDFPPGHAKPEMLYAYVRGTPGQPHYEVLAVQDLGGTIGREPLNKEAVERGARQAGAGARQYVSFDYRKTKWRGFDLDVVVTRLKQGDADIVAIATQVPLKSHAMNLMTSGSASDEAQVMADLERVLATFDGKSNWLSDDERSERLGRVVGFLVALPLGIWFLVWLKRRRRRAG
jgi:hypothetical protein